MNNSRILASSTETLRQPDDVWAFVLKSIFFGITRQAVTSSEERPAMPRRSAPLTSGYNFIIIVWHEKHVNGASLLPFPL